jgi:hypothetical protein
MPTPANSSAAIPADSDRTSALASATHHNSSSERHYTGALRNKTLNTRIEDFIASRATTSRRAPIATSASS